MTLKELVSKGNVVRFTRYFDGQLWYQVHAPVVDPVGGFFYPIGPEFPVPTSDIGNATFLAEDKAMLFMRYIRKHLETIEKAKVEVVPEAPPVTTNEEEQHPGLVPVHFFAKP